MCLVRNTVGLLLSTLTRWPGDTDRVADRTLVDGEVEVSRLLFAVELEYFAERRSSARLTGSLLMVLLMVDTSVSVFTLIFALGFEVSLVLKLLRPPAAARVAEFGLFSRDFRSFTALGQNSSLVPQHVLKTLIIKP